MKHLRASRNDISVALLAGAVFVLVLASVAFHQKLSGDLTSAISGEDELRVMSVRVSTTPEHGIPVFVQSYPDGIFGILRTSEGGCRISHEGVRPVTGCEDVFSEDTAGLGGVVLYASTGDPALRVYGGRCADLSRQWFLVSDVSAGDTDDDGYHEDAVSTDQEYDVAPAVAPTHPAYSFTGPNVRLPFRRGRFHCIFTVGPSVL